MEAWSTCVCVCGGGGVGGGLGGFKKPEASSVQEKLERVEKRKIEQKMDKNPKRSMLKFTQIYLKSTLISTQRFVRSIVRKAKIM